MRPNNNQNNKNRQRSRNGGRKHVNPLSRNFESNGPDVKVRGNAAHIAEKYMQLARDAQSSGDSVMAENYLQHAEHYFRIVSSAQQAQNGQRPDGQGPDDGDYDDDMPDMNSRFASPQPQVQQQYVQGEGDEQPQQQSAQQPEGERQERGDRQERGEQRRERPQRTRPERFRPEGEVQQSAPIEPTSQPVAAEAVDVAGADASVEHPVAVEADGEARKPRERRPRRRRPAGGDAGADPAEADQPDVGELPAFLTGGKAATAAE